MHIAVYMAKLGDSDIIYIFLGTKLIGYTDAKLTYLGI